MASGALPPHVEVAPSPTGLGVLAGALDGEGKRRRRSQHLDSAVADLDPLVPSPEGDPTGELDARSKLDLTQLAHQMGAERSCRHG
jgi:hypothetical protein